MNLFCIGLSHHETSVETLERYGGGAGTHLDLRACGCAEALLLATCNRVEIYGAAERNVPTEEIVRCLARKIDNYSIAEPGRFYRYENEECAQHLFRVASGLDSMIVGETEILGQVKKTYESARRLGAAGPYMHRLFQRTFRVAKQVRTHTEITRGSVSVGSVAVDLAEKIFGNLAKCKVLVLGAGETSERTVRALVSHGVTDLLVSNRSADRADNLTRQVGGRAIPFERWLEQCREIDILITATASEQPLLARENLGSILRERIERPLFIIDIAVPRDVDPSVNDLEGVYLYDIDSLQAVAAQSLALRRQQISAAETIIAEHVAKFCESLGGGLSGDCDGPEHRPIGEEPLGASR
jgi:glutamyl-tRNA reductase